MTMEEPIFHYPDTPEPCWSNISSTCSNNNMFCNFEVDGTTNSSSSNTLSTTSSKISETKSFWQIPSSSSPQATVVRLPTKSSSLSSTTENHPEMKSATKLLATEMNNLSLQEREKVYEDVHGVGESIKETDEIITNSLSEMDEILSHNAKPSSAYKIAEQMSKEFVHDTKLRLMFLRASCFDTKRAATQFIQFFDWKLHYFGSDKLTTKITLDDLDDEAIQCLECGRCQFLPVRDQGGRAIFFCSMKRLYKFQNAEAMMRACWYQVMAALEDEETQRNGFVVVNYFFGASPLDPSEHQTMIQGSRFTHFMPFRMAGLHICCDHSKILTLTALMLNGVDMNSRVRARFHQGSHTECQFALMTFGIPVKVLPISTDGKTKTTNHMKWIERRRKMEEESKYGKEFNGLDLPTRYDVLLGRGKPIQDHPGNIYFRQLIESHREEYENAERGGKINVAKSIVEHIQSKRGRFLRQESNGWWYTASDTVSKEKVCSLFRKVVIKKDRQLLSSSHNIKKSMNVFSNADAKRIKTDFYEPQ